MLQQALALVWRRKICTAAHSIICANIFCRAGHTYTMDKVRIEGVVSANECTGSSSGEEVTNEQIKKLRKQFGKD